MCRRTLWASCAILRSLEASQTRIAEMRSRLVMLWIGAMLAGIALTYLLARRLLRR